MCRTRLMDLISELELAQAGHSGEKGFNDGLGDHRSAGVAKPRQRRMT